MTNNERQGNVLVSYYLGCLSPVPRRMTNTIPMNFPESPVPRQVSFTLVACLCARAVAFADVKEEELLGMFGPAAGEKRWGTTS
jgi:hypothetical protein